MQSTDHIGTEGLDHPCIGVVIRNWERRVEPEATGGLNP